MPKINYNILFGCLILSIGIIIHGYITKPNTNHSLNSEAQNANIKESKAVLDLTETAEYLNMNEAQVKAIIITESTILRQTGSFTGGRLPYFKVDKKYYFYRGGLDGWLEDVTRHKREYDTKNYRRLR